MTIQELIEDYQRKIEFIDDMLESSSGEKLLRLTTKKGCYKSFITDLERLIIEFYGYKMEPISFDSVKRFQEGIKKMNNSQLKFVTSSIACDVCGFHPSTIIQTQYGKFCSEHVKY